MGSSFAFSFLLFLCVLSPHLVLSGPLLFHSLPLSNFTASFYAFIDTSGAFLSSVNGSFQAAIASINPESGSFYFVVLHFPSHEVVWCANRNTPVSESSQLHLSPSGLTLSDDSRNPVWSTTPKLPFRSASYLQLEESGNLILLDQSNVSVWESFDHPTDRILPGQRLRVGQSLVASANENGLSEGDYRLTVTENDAIFQWKGMIYWKLSMEKAAFRDANTAVEYMEVNSTGIYLVGASAVVIQAALKDLTSTSEFRCLKLESSGQLTSKKFTKTIGRSDWTDELSAPAETCRIPYICQSVGLCSRDGSCSCPPAFHGNQKMNCEPTDMSLKLPVPCNGNRSGRLSTESLSYVKLEKGMDYFSNAFAEPVLHDVNLSVCQNLCNGNCSCLGVFHDLSSGSCYVIKDYLGSIWLRSDSQAKTDRTGYIKVMVDLDYSLSENGKSQKNFPVVALVLLTSVGFFLVLVVGGMVWLRRRKRLFGNGKVIFRRESSSSSTEMELVSIPGLPVRFEYNELVEATENFSTQIGSGGFGTVYKGTLSDGAVAVKKITCLGIQGKREFGTEIAIIGNIHHVNLVKLKGYCAQRGQRFLVYEYMNRGSLDRTLFGNGPVLEWGERFDIALGTARGLAYLHNGCDHKIIHCDVKPENILLSDNLQVKISDFGLSKLLSPEESGLFTTMRGTRGYLAPEWLTSSVITDKTDVYSYGMVLLEIVRGRKNSSIQTQISSSGSNSSRVNRQFSSSSSSGHRLIYFPLFALEMHEGRNYMELVDPRLVGHVTSEEVEKLIRVALCCVHEDPGLRPTMSNVVGMLEGGLPLREPRIESLNFLRFYGQRFTELSTVGGENGQNEFVLYRQPTGNLSSGSSSSYNSFSYMTSQQVSGPR